ncbi:chemotaxis protein (plasmid) [Azospirillum humicireducens]|uniref:Chemotaxis protein n=1 Tax=Azospirillum humicireducens TaxID=1226968 RepID=A0A2R4VTZ6_9PROT|nr:cache domain-containing protein [Azospirillum humicireducens]AWB07915.1 chemotaxis protein [Azospirillum humicireducens]
MKHLSMFWRLSLIIGIAAIAFCGVSVSEIMSLRQTILTERQEKLRDMVGSVLKMVEAYDEDVKSGRLTREQAQDLAKRTLRSMRWGDGDYYGVYQFDGLTIVHSNPKNEGVNRLDYTDANGKRLVSDIVETAKQGGGYTEYAVPRSGGTEALPKLSYVGGYSPWLWAIQAGVYVDDVDTAVRERAIKLGSTGLLALLLTGGSAAVLGRGITRPLHALCGTLDSLAQGNRATQVPFTDCRNEIGRIARAVEVLKTSAQEADRLREEQEQNKRLAVERQRADMERVARQFETSVGAIARTLTVAASEMQETAHAMSVTSGRASEQTTVAAAAAMQATTNVQTVAAASEELTASIGEISQQVARSAQIAVKAVEETRRTDTTVEELSTAAQKIGEIIGLIQSIASQTDLLALNATIEAARAGDHGKGFAVVANEVKALARQASQASGDIAQRIAAVQGISKDVVGAIRSIGSTIGELNGIASTIASAVEEQAAATHEIARNVSQAAQGTSEVSANISGVTRSSAEVGDAAGSVLAAARTLAQQSDQLQEEVDSVLATIRRS